MILCGCGGEKRSSCGEVIWARYVRVQVQYGGCQTHGLDEGVDRRGENGENVQVGEERHLLESGDEICEASLDPDNGEEFGEICPFVRVIFCRAMDESWMSTRYDHEKLVLTEAGDHGLENGLELDDGVENPRVLHGPGAPGEELLVVHGCVEVEKSVLWTSGRDENDVGSVTWCLCEISRNEWRFVCECGMKISWIWCANDIRCHHEVE